MRDGEISHNKIPSGRWTGDFDAPWLRLSTICMSCMDAACMNFTVLTPSKIAQNYRVHAIPEHAIFRPAVFANMQQLNSGFVELDCSYVWDVRRRCVPNL